MLGLLQGLVPEFLTEISQASIIFVVIALRSPPEIIGGFSAELFVESQQHFWRVPTMNSLKNPSNIPAAITTEILKESEEDFQ